MRDIYSQLFFYSGNFRYAGLLRTLKFKHMITTTRDDKDHPESVCFTIMKDNWCSSYTWSFTMLNSLDDETLLYTVDEKVLGMINDISQRILDETKL